MQRWASRSLGHIFFKSVTLKFWSLNILITTASIDMKRPPLHSSHQSSQSSRDFAQSIGAGGLFPEGFFQQLTSGLKCCVLYTTTVQHPHSWGVLGSENEILSETLIVCYQSPKSISNDLDSPVNQTMCVEYLDHGRGGWPRYSHSPALFCKMKEQSDHVSRHWAGFIQLTISVSN